MESPLTPSVDGNQGSSLWPASSKCVVNGCWQLCNILVVIRLHLALVSVARLFRFSLVMLEDGKPNSFYVRVLNNEFQSHTVA